MATFKKGIYTENKKHLSEEAKIERITSPKFVYVPLAQHIGKPSQAVVNPLDKVKKGQLIAKAVGYVSANIFSPISGEVKGIEHLKNAFGDKAPHIVIENDFTDSEVRLEKLENPTSEQIIQRAFDAGIVGMGGAGFPLHTKLSANGKVIDKLIINAAECEPYITCDYRILLERTDDFLKGVELLKIALNAKEVLVGVKQTHKYLIGKLSAYSLWKVVPLSPKYPQGAEKQLIFAVCGRKVPVGGLPVDIGCMVSNVHTALALYYASEGRPLYERVLTVSGEGIVTPKNVLAPIGIKFKEIVDFCEGSKDTDKIISGGTMTGFSQSDLECVVTKTTSSLVLLTHNETNHTISRPCINCARCREVCPMNLMPMYIDNYALAGQLEISKKYGALNCMECGCCSFICPSKRPLVQSIRLAKKMIREKERKQ